MMPSTTAVFIGRIEGVDPLEQRIRHVLAVKFDGSPSEASEAAGLRRGHISKYFTDAKKRAELGKPPPTFDVTTLQKMAKGWGVSFDYLAHGTGPGPGATVVELDDRYHGRGEAIPMLRQMGVSEATVQKLRSVQKQDYEGKPAIWWVRKGLEVEEKRDDPFFAEEPPAKLDPDV